MINEWDKEIYLMPVFPNKTEWRGQNQIGKIKELPLAIKLIDVEQKDKIYAKVIAFTKDGLERHGTISVNRPMHISKWNIYLDKYDPTTGNVHAFFKIVSTSWNWLMYSGMFFLVIGCISFLFKLNK